MRRTRFDNASCPIARTSDLLGDWWTPLILREFFYGRHRFEELAESLEISRAVLTQRLKRFEAEGLVQSRQYQENPPRREYRLTEKGRDLWSVLAAMWRFGEDWLFDGEPIEAELFNPETGETIHPTMVDANTGEPLDIRSTRLRTPKVPKR